MANKFGGMGAAISNAAQTIKNPSSQLNGPVDNSTDAIYKSARQFYNSGNSEAGNNVLRDYYAQTVNKNSQYYQAQYSYWDEANGDEQKTLAAESDLLNMYNAVNDAVGKGYSDSWIKNNISTTNYPGLASLTNDTVLTRQLQYWGDETVNGMIYAARNPEDEINGQDIRSAAGMYGLRWGNSYRPNYKSEAAKDPKSDIYHPYMQGNHADDEEAKNTAISAKEQLARLQKACLARLDKGQTPDEIYDLYFGNNMHGLDWGVDDEPAYFTLHQMEDARQHQTAVPLSEDVDFAAPYFKQWLYDQAEDKQAQKGELDALAQSQYLTRQYTSLTENVPEAYQEAVWALYAQDKGITEVTAEAYTGLDAWLKENGLIGKQDDFREAYNSAAANLAKKWDSEVRPNEKFSPATFIVDGENADPETNDKQVSFRRGMQNYLAGRPTNNADAKAFAQKYGFLFDNYQYNASTAADAVEANIVQMSLENRPARADSLGSELDEALDRLDAARFDGKITDEEYFNHYLEIATAYDNYKTLAAQKGETADPKGFADYLGKGADVYGNTFSDKFVESIGQTITAGESAYEERRKAEVAAVSQRFGQFERDANSGKVVDNDEFKQIRGIEINPSEFQDDLSNKFDMAYTGAYNYAMTAHLDPTREYGAHYDESYARLASYDVAEVVNDIMRLAQYTDTDFTSACNAMGFDTEDDLYAYLDNYAYSVNKKCSNTVEALYTVGGQLLQSAAGTTADDLVLNEKIDLNTYTLFMNGMGNADNEQKFYNRVGDLGGIPAAALVYKDALEESHPNENEAHGYSSNIFDIALNGSWNGLLTHANSWVMAALGFQSLTDAERENRARLDFNNDPAAYRAEIQSAIETIDDPKVRQEAFEELASYNGDIFKFDFDTNRFTIALQDANRDLNERRNALDAEMKEFFSPAAYKAYTGLGSAVNSGFISLESVMVGKALMAFGMTKGPAMFLGQLVTTGPIEGGETAYKLKQAGVNSPLANLTGLANGAAIAAIEWGSDAFVNKFAYKNKFIKRIEDYGKINVASKVLQVQDALDAAGIKGGAAWLLRNGARFGLGAINTGFGMLKSTGSEIVQELGEYTLTGGLEYGAASLAGVNADQFAPTLEGAGEIAVATGISTQFQKILPWNFGKTILDTVRNTNTQNSFVNDTRNTTLDLKARTESEIGAVGNEMAAMQAEIDAATAERQAAMDKLKGMNIEARVDQETLKNLEEPALALQNSELSRKINDLTERDVRLQNDLTELNAQHEEAAARVEEVQAAIDAGDVSKETLDWLNDCTGILRTLDRRTSETQTGIDSNTEELTKLKAEKQAQRQQAYDAARQQAIDTVTDEVTTDEAERLMDSIDRSDKLIAETKAKHEAAKNRVQTLLENYQAELRRLEAETRSTAGEINSMSEDGDILSDGLVDLALGISNEMNNIDVAEATAKEASIKASLVKQLEMSFNGYKVEMRPMGRGNHGKVAIDGGNGIIILNSDSTSYELMNGELGYELGRMAQISSPADYKALYDAATKAVYGSKEGTEKAYSKVFARLVSEGVTTDTTQPNNAVVRAGSEVFADAIGRLFSGEFRNNKWVQDFSETAPELAGDIFDWIAMRAKEFKAMAKHGDKQLKAQYNAIVDALSKLADSLHKSDTVDFNGETVPVDVTPVVAEETRTDDASDFVNSLVHRRLNETRKRYVGEKRLPLFEKQDDGSYTIDRGGLTTEENDLISEVERAELQAEYNALNGEVTAETLKSEAAEAIGKPLRRKATAEEAATEQPTEQQTEQAQPTSRDKLADAVADMIDNAAQLDEDARNKAFGAIRGLIHNIKNGNRSNADATSTPLAIVKNLFDGFGGTLYQNILNVKDKTPVQVNSRPGYIASKRLLVRDMNAYIDAAGEHVMNAVQHEVDTNGVTTDLTSNTPEANIAMFNAWLTAGIDGLRGMSRFAVDTLNDFGDKLHLALINSKDGRTMWAALNEAKDKLAAYYNADAIRRAQAYVRSTPESQQSGQFSAFLKRKAEFLGQDLYGDVFDSMTGYGTSFRKALRYLPYAKSLGNMWVGDHDTAKGFIDLDRKKVLGAQTMSEAVRSPFNARYFAKHKAEIWKNVNLMLALQSALDRYTPLEQVETKNGKPVLDENGNPKIKKVNRDPFSGLTDKGLTEAAKFLGINGHPTKESIQAAINELSRDHRLVEAADNVREWWRNVMRIAVKEGMVTQETYDKFQQENPHYAPLQRDMSTIVKKGRHTDSNPTTTQGELDITSSGISFRRAKGHSDRAVIDPLLSFAEMAQQMADKLVANRTAKEFVRIYDAAPYDSIGMFAGEVSNGQGNALARKGTDILNVYYEDGTHRSFVVNNPELLQLLQGKELNADRSGWMKGLAHVTRFMSRLTTTDNPIFAIRNAIRDYQTSVNYGSWAGSYIDGIGKWLSALGECLRYTYSKSWNELFHNDNEGKADGQLRDFLFYGGEGFMRKSMTHNNKENIYGEVMGESWGRRALSSTWDLLTFGTLNDAVEMASRYVEYKYGKSNETNDAKGATDQSKFNSFMDSREVTVDFAQAGYGTLAKTIRQVVPFFNATLQGWYRTGRMFTQAERGRLAARATKTILNNTVAGALSATLCCFGKSTLGAFLGDDDAWEEQVKEYLKLSNSLKTDFIILPLTGLGFIGAKDFIRAPLLQDGLGKFCFNMGRLEVERVARRMRGEDVTIGGLGKDLLRIAWDVFKEPFDRDITLQPIIDMALNRTFYGTPLVNENKLDDDPHTWANATTPEFAITISDAERAALKWLFGDNLPQWVNLIFSPAGVEYTFKEYFGYVGQVALPIISRDKYTGDIKGFSGLANSIIGNFTLDAESSNDISTNWKNAQDTITRISKLTEDGIGISPLSSYLTTEERYSAVMEAKKALKEGGVIYDARQKDKELWAEYNRIMADQSIPEKEREKAAEIIRKQINDNEAEATAWEEAFEAKYMPKLNIISSMIDSVRAGRQTLKDSGEGVTKAEEPTASTNPADLPVAQAGMPNLGDLTQTLPYIGEESENVQTPLTSPDYTGERVRGVTTDYMGQQTETPTAEQTPEFSIASIAPTPTTPTTSRSAAEVGEDVAEGAESITNRGWNSHRRRQPQPITPANATAAAATQPTDEQPTWSASKYNMVSRVNNVEEVYRHKKRQGLDGWAQTNVRTLYGNDLSEKFYSDMTRFMSIDKTSTKYVPIPNDYYEMDSVKYELKDYHGAYADVANWYADAYADAWHEMENSPKYLNATEEEQMSMFRELDTQANTAAKKRFILKYVSSNTKGVANNLSDTTINIATNLGKNHSYSTCEDYVRQVYGSNMPDKWYKEFEAAWKHEASTNLLPFPSPSTSVNDTTYYTADYSGAQKDVENWYFDKWSVELEKVLKSTDYVNGTQDEKNELLGKLDSKANTYAMTNFKLKYLGV